MVPLIEVKDLVKIYYQGKVAIPALRGISLSIDPGEFISIQGASGSGKSTFLNILGCLDLPSQGRYLLKGEEVSRLRPHQLASIRNRHIGFVFQGFNLLPWATSLENVELPLLYADRPLPSKKRRELALAMLERVGLAGREDHLPSQLSGGEQQRVAIARALVNEPEIILADEPTGNLDSETSREIMEILRELNQGHGITIVLVTHEAEIAAYSQRRVFFRDGQIIRDSKDEPTSQPKDGHQGPFGQ